MLTFCLLQATIIGCAGPSDGNAQYGESVVLPPGFVLDGYFMTAPTLRVDRSASRTPIALTSSTGKAPFQAKARAADILEHELYQVMLADVEGLMSSGRSVSAYKPNAGPSLVLEIDEDGVIRFEFTGIPGGSEAIKAATRHGDELTVFAVASPFADPVDAFRNELRIDGFPGALKVVFSNFEGEHFARSLRIDVVEPASGFIPIIERADGNRYRIVSARPPS